MRSNGIIIQACICLTLFLFYGCFPQVELTTSWKNNNAAKAKSSPKIMVLAIGKSVANRQSAESFIVSELQKKGFNAMGSLEIFKPNVQKYDSVEMVRLLLANNVDLLLTNAVVNVTEKETYIEPSTYTTPTTTQIYPTYGYGHGGYSNGYNSGFYGYYGARTDMYYGRTYETQTTPGYTVVDVQVLIESNLYDVHSSELLWMAQSTSYTKDPSTSLFRSFAKIVVGDLTKKNMINL